MKAINLAITGVIALGAVAPANADTFVYDGSDTLATVTNYLIGLGTCGDLNYLEGGSSMGERAMCASPDADPSLSGDPWQTTAPMSRALKTSNICDAQDCPNYVEGRAFNRHVGWDGLAVARNKNTEDGCSDLGAGWEATLRTIYGGIDGSGSPEACGHEDRRNLLADYSRIYNNADCGTENCTELKYAFRRGTGSGTTGVFMKLTNVTNFCNVPDHTDAKDRYANDNGDMDPVRRCCSAPGMGFGGTDRYCPGNPAFDPYTMPGGEVCERTIGVVLPIDVPAAGSFNDPSDALAANNNTNCASGKFGFAIPFPGSATCPTGDAKAGGLCRYPQDSQGNFGCNNNFINKPAGIPLTWDGRLFNNTPRRANGTSIYNPFNQRSEFWRMARDCDKTSSTNQIGCIAGKHDCSIGWAGREMIVTNPNDAMAVTIEGKSPMNNNDIGEGPGKYPLARKLYFNTLDNFESTQPDEQALIDCYSDPNKVKDAMEAAGYIPLEGLVSFTDEAVSCN